MCIGSSPEEHPSKSQTVEIALLLYYYSYDYLHVYTGSSSEEDTRNGKSANELIVLTEADSQTICESLKTASYNWFNLGFALGVKIYMLKNIERRYQDDHRCLIEMVSKRLDVTDPKHPMTWPYICECLRSAGVERNDVATEIEDNYVRTATAVATNLS